MATSLTIADIDESTKLRFAEAFLRSQNQSAAAMQVIPDLGLAMRAALTLPSDPVVIAEMERLKEEFGEEIILPSKVEVLREIYDKAKACGDPKDYESLMKLYCNARGYIEKPGANVGVKVEVASVMVVRDKGSDEEWAEKVAAQQQRLVLNAAN
jgi:hypothetical protein